MGFGICFFLQFDTSGASIRGIKLKMEFVCKLAFYHKLIKTHQPIMQKSNKRIHFQKEIEPVGFEIVKLEDFFNEQPQVKIGKCHIINFYIILFITEGKGIHPD